MLEVKRKPASHSHGTATAHARIHSDLVPARDVKDFQAKSAVITGEIHFKGVMPVDGAVTGQIGSGSSLNVKQRPSASFATQAELAGEISFKDMVRVNGHVSGSIYSKTGTLIVDLNARIDANVDVAVAIVGGTVTGDIIARQRVELGPTSKIYGNIWTRSLVIKDGAIFEGVCRMLDEEAKTG